ncbi:MAG: type II 3-dehydroquinate dehydratase [Actinomycetota bacterium]|nr:type II 3-dehydroquinate dehydratase [Actinomycetota bacterium]
MSSPLVLIVNGPKLNTLGTREPEIYGTTTLAQIEEMLRKRAAELDLDLEFFQSDVLDELIRAIRGARERAAAIVMNPAAFTHYALALRDAVEEAGVPLYEVHLSNIYARETFRRHSVISPVAAGVVCGLGPAGYVAALEAAARKLKGNA